MSPWEALSLHDSEVLFEHEVEAVVNVWIEDAHDDDASFDSSYFFRLGDTVVGMDGEDFYYGHRYAAVAEATSVMDALHEVEANDAITREDH